MRHICAWKTGMKAAVNLAVFFPLSHFTVMFTEPERKKKISPPPLMCKSDSSQIYSSSQVQYFQIEWKDSKINAIFNEKETQYISIKKQMRKHFLDLTDNATLRYLSKKAFLFILVAKWFRIRPTHIDCTPAFLWVRQSHTQTYGNLSTFIVDISISVSL